MVDRVGLYVQAYTLYSSVRPFGCSTIIGGVDKTGPALFVIEPSGVSYVSFVVVSHRTPGLALFHTGLPRRSSREGSAVSKDRVGEAQALRADNTASSPRGSKNVRTQLFPGSTAHLIPLSIYLVHDDAKEKDFELELSWIGDETNGLHLPVPKDLYDEASRKAKESLENFD